jgi:hypothetical protein
MSLKNAIDACENPDRTYFRHHRLGVQLEAPRLPDRGEATVARRRVGLSRDNGMIL